MSSPNVLCFSVLYSARHQPPTPAALLGSVSSGGATRSKLHIFVEWLPLPALGGEERSAASGGTPDLGCKAGFVVARPVHMGLGTLGAAQRPTSCAPAEPVLLVFAAP